MDVRQRQNTGLVAHSQQPRSRNVQLRHTSVVVGILQPGALPWLEGLPGERRYPHVARGQEEVGKVNQYTNRIHIPRNFIIAGNLEILKPSPLTYLHTKSRRSKRTEIFDISVKKKNRKYFWFKWKLE